MVTINIITKAKKIENLLVLRQSIINNYIENSTKFRWYILIDINEIDSIPSKLLNELQTSLLIEKVYLYFISLDDKSIESILITIVEGWNFFLSDDKVLPNYFNDVFFNINKTTKKILIFSNDLSIESESMFITRHIFFLLDHVNYNSDFSYIKKLHNEHYFDYDFLDIYKSEKKVIVISKNNIESDFDFFLLKNDFNIEYFNFYYNPKLIITIDIGDWGMFENLSKCSEQIRNKWIHINDSKELDTILNKS